MFLSKNKCRFFLSQSHFQSKTILVKHEYSILFYNYFSSSLLFHVCFEINSKNIKFTKTCLIREFYFIIFFENFKVMYNFNLIFG